MNLGNSFGGVHDTSLMFSNKQLLLSKTGKQVPRNMPPIDEETRYRINQTLN